MRTEHTGSDAAVVGGGMAVLTVACYLTRTGIDVSVFEKAPELRSRAATQNVDGFRFNRGGHALYTRGAAARVLEELGISYEYGVPKDTYVLQAEKLPLPCKPDRALAHRSLGCGGQPCALSVVRSARHGQTACPGEDERPGTAGPQGPAPSAPPADNGGRTHVRLSSRPFS